MDDQPKPRRRVLRFSLRAMLVSILVVGAGLGLLVRERQRIAQRRAGLIDAGFVTLSPSREQSRWSVYLLGDQRPANANDLAGCSRTTDAGLVHVQGLTKLRSLYLVGDGISDDGMAYLAGLEDLRTLSLAGTRITDAGLVHLERLAKLERLDLGMTRVSDAGLVHLRSLSQLAYLDLSETAITDAGLLHLAGLTRLKGVYVGGTKVTEAGEEELRRGRFGLSVCH